MNRAVDAHGVLTGIQRRMVGHAAIIFKSLGCDRSVPA
jgi:hypothetical protein